MYSKLNSPSYTTAHCGKMDHDRSAEASQPYEPNSNKLKTVGE